MGAATRVGHPGRVGLYRKLFDESEEGAGYTSRFVNVAVFPPQRWPSRITDRVARHERVFGGIVRAGYASPGALGSGSTEGRGLLVGVIVGL